jgi:hypothetical protein
MPEPKTYAGGCHCGRVHFEAASGLAPDVTGYGSIWMR